MGDMHKGQRRGRGGRVAVAGMVLVLSALGSAGPSCDRTSRAEEGPMADGKKQPEEAGNVQVGVRLVKLKRVRDDHWGFGHTVSYLVELSRSDVTEESGAARAKLRPKLMYVSTATESKTMCDRPRVPHACEVRVEDGQPEPSEIVLDITFDDGVERRITLAVPAVPKHGPPTIHRYAAQESPEPRYEVAFKDVGAPRYRVVLQLYRESRGNPYTDVELAVLERQEDGALSLTASPKWPEAFVVTHSVTDGVVEVRGSGGVLEGGELAVVAVCGEELRAATDDLPEVWLRECDIQRLH